MGEGEMNNIFYISEIIIFEVEMNDWQRDGSFNFGSTNWNRFFCQSFEGLERTIAAQMCRTQMHMWLLSGRLSMNKYISFSKPRNLCKTKR